MGRNKGNNIQFERKPDMSSVGFISDLHLDINKISDDEAKMTLMQVITDKQLDVLVLVGDTYNNFQRTETLVQELNEKMMGETRVFFISGNHDMARGVDEVTIEESHPNYLHKSWFDVPNSDIRVIGHNGWYDYTWAPQVTNEEASAFHHGLYFDRVIPQKETDIERTDRALVEMQALFTQAQLDKKQIVFATHFVPIKDDLHEGEDPRIGLVNAIMGSKRIGELIQSQENVVAVVFGHQHVNSPIRYYGDVSYANVAVGIKKRRQEWLESDLLSTIEEKMYIFSK